MEVNNNPRLVEPGALYFFNETLKKCQDKKYKNYNMFFNITLFALFVIILGAFLTYKYKGKLTDKEKKNKKKEIEDYIITKVNIHKNNNRKKSNQNITGLPEFQHINDYFANKYFT